MGTTKKLLVTSFALFSLFFGAGNLILPPLLGLSSGTDWWRVTLGFSVSAVLIPLLGILAHARLQGTIYDFGKKVSPTFSLVYSFIVYAISIALPSPRTASVTHEMAVLPYTDLPSWATSTAFFLLVFLFAMNRSSILDIIGKLLTPAILLLLLLLIANTMANQTFPVQTGSFNNPIVSGILEGYQTFDAIGAVVVGGVIIVSLNLEPQKSSYANKKSIIGKAGILAGLALFLVYAGLILSGAMVQGIFDMPIARTALLAGMAQLSLGPIGSTCLSALVALACFTTAVGIVTGTADFVKAKANNNHNAYGITALTGCILGVVIGQFNVSYIIAVALPALMFIYPITIVLIILNVMPTNLAGAIVFRAVTATTVVFSVPAFLESIALIAPNSGAFSWIPFQEFSLGWALPACIVFMLFNAFGSLKRRSKA